MINRNITLVAFNSKTPRISQLSTLPAHIGARLELQISPMTRPHIIGVDEVIYGVRLSIYFRLRGRVKTKFHPKFRDSPTSIIAASQSRSRLTSRCRRVFCIPICLDILDNGLFVDIGRIHSGSTRCLWGRDCHESHGSGENSAPITGRIGCKGTGEEGIHGGVSSVTDYCRE